VRLTTSPPSCANWLETWEPQTPGSLWACPVLYRDCFTVHSKERCVRWNPPISQYNTETARATSPLQTIHVVSTLY